MISTMAMANQEIGEGRTEEAFRGLELGFDVGGGDFMVDEDEEAVCFGGNNEL